MVDKVIPMPGTENKEKLKGAKIGINKDWENPLAFNIKLDVNWGELIDQANLLEGTVKSMAEGYEKATAVIEEKRPADVIGFDCEKAIRSYRALAEHYRHLEEGAVKAKKSLEEALRKYGG